MNKLCDSMWHAETECLKLVFRTPGERRSHFQQKW